MKTDQMSASLPVGILLALAGGFMDAYSYMARGHVFANAQTGNILLFAIAVSEGRPGDSLRYLLPVVSFAVGIALTAAIRTRKAAYKRRQHRTVHRLCRARIASGKRCEQQRLCKLSWRMHAKIAEEQMRYAQQRKIYYKSGHIPSPLRRSIYVFFIRLIIQHTRLPRKAILIILQCVISKVNVKKRFSWFSYHFL